MLKNFKSILFTTDLSSESRSAFKYVALLGMQLKADVVLLHVLEELPESYKSLAMSHFGEKRWNDILDQHRRQAKTALVGKLSNSQIVQATLNEFCLEAGINSDQCGYVQNEIIVKEGGVVDTILQQADETGCDLIAMAVSKGVLSSGGVLGNHIRSVVKKAHVPVMVVPTATGKEKT
jgi:nucleotide-binding universal stress UspA family protein